MVVAAPLEMSAEQLGVGGDGSLAVDVRFVRPRRCSLQPMGLPKRSLVGLRRHRSRFVVGGPALRSRGWRSVGRIRPADRPRSARTRSNQIVTGHVDDRPGRVDGVVERTVRRGQGRPRIWRSRGLSRGRSTRSSTDPDFEAKVIGRRVLNPPEAAAVFAFDEKTQVQALDRSQPSLPMVGRAGTMTTTIDATAAGPVRGDERRQRRGPPRQPPWSHRSRRCWRLIDLHVPAGQELHGSWTTSPRTSPTRAGLAPPADAVGTCTSRPPRRHG